MLVGTTIGPYRLTGLLGEGTTGQVYRAVHESLNREVALKVLANLGSGNDPHHDRLRREMRVATAINHPNLAKIFDCALENENPYIAMELVEGLTLATLVEAAALPWPVALRLGQQLARALEYLHLQGILHRDVKPANILVTPNNHVKLVDFGLSRRFDSTALTPVGLTVGTPMYLAPELLEGEVAGESSDLWALGCVFSEMLTGQHPLAASGLPIDGWVAAILRGVVTDPRRIVPEIPRGIARFAVALLARVPGNRPAPAGQIAGILEAMSADPEFARKGVETGNPVRQAGDSRPVGPVERENGTRTIVLEAPTGRVGPGPFAMLPPFTTKSGMTAGIFILAVAVLGIASLRRSPSVQRGNSGGSSRVPAISPRSAPSALFPPPLWGRWQECQRWLSVSHQEENLRRDTLLSLQKSVGVPLGRSAEAWLHWVQLGRWFAAGAAGRPPAYVHAFRRPVDALVEMTIESDISNAAGSSLPEQLAWSLQLTGAYPEDARSWLALSAILGSDGDADEARRARRQALSELKDTTLRGCPFVLWQALARGLLDAGGDRLDREWIALVSTDGESTAPWIGLNAALGGTAAYRFAVGSGDNAIRFQRLLNLARLSPKAGAGATEYLGDSLLASSKVREAIQVWTQYALIHPRIGWVGNRLLECVLDCGYIDQGLSIAKTMTDETHSLVFAAVSAPINRSVSFSRGLYGSTAWVQTGIPTAMALLMDGKPIAAVDVLNDPPLRSVTAHPTILLYIDLAGMEHPSPWAIERSHRLAVQTMGELETFKAWDALAGGLASPSGTVLFNAWRQEAVRAGNPLKGELVQAVHLSRSGRLDEASRILPQDDGPSPCDHDPIWAAEVAARPLWRRRLTGKGAPGGPLAIRPWMTRNPVIQLYLQQLWSGQVTPVVMDMVQLEYEKTPFAAFWGFALAYHAALNGDGDGFLLWQRRITTQVRRRGYGLWRLKELEWLALQLRAAPAKSH